MKGVNCVEHRLNAVAIRLLRADTVRHSRSVEAGGDSRVASSERFYFCELVNKRGER